MAEAARSETEGCVVLVVTRDDAFRQSTGLLLKKAGYSVLSAYSGYSAEFALKRKKIDSVVMDGKVLVWDPKERPRAMLRRFPHLRLVVTNSAVLSDEMRDLVRSHGGRLIDKSDAEQVTKSINELEQEHGHKRLDRPAAGFFARHPEGRGVHAMRYH